MKKNGIFSECRIHAESADQSNWGLKPRLTDRTARTDGTYKMRKTWPVAKRMTHHISMDWASSHIALLCWGSHRRQSGPSSPSIAETNPRDPGTASSKYDAVLIKENSAIGVDFFAVLLYIYKSFTCRVLPEFVFPNFFYGFVEGKN